jgi:hypothetical protein
MVEMHLERFSVVIELQSMKCRGDYSNNALSNLSETGLVTELDEVIRVEFALVCTGCLI